MKKYIDKIKEFGKFIEDNKILITSSVYTLGVAFQLIMLMSYSGFQGFFYVSLKFSIIIFIILLFLFLLSIPFSVLFIIFLLISVFFTFPLWFKIGYISILIFLFLGVFFLKKYNIKKFKKLQKILKDKLNISKFDKFTVHYALLVFILIFISFGYNVFGKKIVVLNTQDNKVVMGELKFYNQEYYFLDVCKNKIILPASEVKSVNMLGDRFYFSQKENKGKLDKINNDYKKYCTIKNVKIIK